MAGFEENFVNQYTTKRRTSVLYDFSSVQKARFYVYSVDNRGVIQVGENGPIEDVLYVQINPSEISVSSDAARRVTSPRANVDKEYAELVPRGSRDYAVNDLSIKLEYNLYDEFSIGTMDGALAAFSVDRNLKSRTATSMERLIELSRMDGKAVMFKWGPFEYFGAVDKADFSYTAFSRFGDPLSASGNVTIKACGYKVGVNGEIDYALNFPETLSGTNSKISSKLTMQSMQTAETALLTAEIAAAGALR